MENVTTTLANGSLLQIRPAEAADASRMLRHVEACSGESAYLSFGPGDFEMTLEQEEEFLEGMASSDNDLYLVALLDGDLVGNIVFRGGGRPRIRHCGEFGMTVRRRCWGLGIGAHLLDALLAWARASSVVTKVDLRVRHDNDRAMGLYESRGFVVEGRISNQVVDDGESFDYVWMGVDATCGAVEP